VNAEEIRRIGYDVADLDSLDLASPFAHGYLLREIAAQLAELNASNGITNININADPVNEGTVAGLVRRAILQAPRLRPPRQ
jgi:hypothetical protein